MVLLETFETLETLSGLLLSIKSALDIADDIAPTDFVPHFSEFNALIQAIVPLCKSTGAQACIELDDFLYDELKLFITEVQRIQAIPNNTTALNDIKDYLTTTRKMPLQKLSKELADRLLLPIVLKTYYSIDIKIDEMKDQVNQAVDVGITAVMINSNENTRKIVDLVISGGNQLNQRISNDHYIFRIGQIVTDLGQLPLSYYPNNFVSQFKNDFETLKFPLKLVGNTTALKYKDYGIDAYMSANQAIEKIDEHMKKLEVKDESPANMEVMVAERLAQEVERNKKAELKHNYGACKVVSSRTNEKCSCSSYKKPNDNEFGLCSTCTHSTMDHMI